MKIYVILTYIEMMSRFNHILLCSFHIAFISHSGWKANEVSRDETTTLNSDYILQHWQFKWWIILELSKCRVFFSVTARLQWCFKTLLSHFMKINLIYILRHWKTTPHKLLCPQKFVQMVHFYSYKRSSKLTRFLWTWKNLF